MYCRGREKNTQLALECRFCHHMLRYVLEVLVVHRDGSKYRRAVNLMFTCSEVEVFRIAGTERESNPRAGMTTHRYTPKIVQRSGGVTGDHGAWEKIHEPS